MFSAIQSISSHCPKNLQHCLYFIPIPKLQFFLSFRHLFWTWVRACFAKQSTKLCCKISIGTLFVNKVLICLYETGILQIHLSFNILSRLR